jgi:hypothetical protein
MTPKAIQVKIATMAWDIACDQYHGYTEWALGEAGPLCFWERPSFDFFEKQYLGAYNALKAAEDAFFGFNLQTSSIGQF